MFRLWLRLGMRMGWVSKPYCMTHDGNYEYMTEEESNMITRELRSIDMSHPNTAAFFKY